MKPTGAKEMERLYQNDARRFFGTLKKLENDPRVREMERYSQHKGTATFRHCHNVAVSSFRLAQRLGLRVEEEALARGAMLHDFHLYTRKKRDFRHVFSHPKLAVRNADRAFRLNDKEKNIIESHMWPLTVFKLPRSREALLVSLADKYCALREMRGKRRMH